MGWYLFYTHIDVKSEALAEHASNAQFIFDQKMAKQKLCQIGKVTGKNYNDLNIIGI